MASDTSSTTSKSPMTPQELIAFVKNELAVDEERQAKVAAASAGEVPRESQTGSTLDLSRKEINALPVEVIVLIKDKVERLALSHNPRIFIPTEIAQCDRLRYLNLRWNKLKQFPEAVLSLHKLEILDISKNYVEGIPEDIKRMTNLKFLAVARNNIKRLPLALGEMNLVKLKFDENPIEFPPNEALQPSSDRTASMLESEKDKDMCQQVKRFMRATSVREKLRTHSEEELSESSVETPRPPRRGVTGGRFPVRPSMSGIENIPNLTGDSPPGAAPPIPQRSHARGISSNVPPAVKRPGITPLKTNGLDTHRSRSETVANPPNMRNRRQGFVPHKNSNMMSMSEMPTQMSAGSTPSAPGSAAFPSHPSQVSAALTPPHSRAPSTASSYRDYLTPTSAGETSSGAVSPIDGPVGRANLTRTLDILPESRNSRLPTINSIKAVKRVLFMLSYLYRPLVDVALQLKGGTPKRTFLERYIDSANVAVENLHKLVLSANSTMEGNAEIEPALLAEIIRQGIAAIQKYASALKELGRQQQQVVKHIDGFHVRCVINTAYGTMIEARNVCHMLGFRIKTLSSRDTLRASRAGSSRTVTPTQPKSASSRRRGPTILPSGGSTTSLRGAAPTVPLHNGSRSNTMTSMGPAPTPRYNDSFSSMLPRSNVPSRSNTMRSVTEGDQEESADQIFLKLKSCCELASQTLPSVRGELAARKTNADHVGHQRASRNYAQAITKCDFVIATNNKLLSRLRQMKVGDPARYVKEFSQMMEGFGRDWTNFVDEVVKLAHQGIEIGHIRRTLKPLQHAVKDANRATAFQSAPQIARPPPSASLHGAFPTALNTAIAQNSGLPPVPATPLGAALGPAVQATVPPTPTTAVNSPEYYFPPDQPRNRPMPERSQTTLPASGYPRRERS